MSVFDSEVYAESRKSRLRNLFEHVRPESLKGKRVFELGCGTGELGEEFVKLGCHVTSVDARLEHIEELRRRFPDRAAEVVNLDAENCLVFGSMDIVVCFGLLYHLSEPARFLACCCELAPVLYLETVVLDSDFPECPRVAESGSDQSFVEQGTRPSVSWLLAALVRAGYSHMDDISGASANWATAQFDWTRKNDRQWIRDGKTLRRMIICSV